MKKESGIEPLKSEKEQTGELPEKVRDMGNSVFFFETRRYENFLETLTKFKELKKELRITAISPIWNIQGHGSHVDIEGYCVNCEEREKEE